MMVPLRPDKLVLLEPASLSPSAICAMIVPLRPDKLVLLEPASFSPSAICANVVPLRPDKLVLLEPEDSPEFCAMLFWIITAWVFVSARAAINTFVVNI